VTIDLDGQLRTYGEYLDGVAADLDVDRLEATWEIEAAPAGPGRLRGWRVAVVVAAAMLLLIGGIAALARILTEDTTPVTEPPTSTTLPVPTPDAVPLPGTQLVATGVSAFDIVTVVPADGLPLIGYWDADSMTVLKCGDPECASSTTILEVEGHSLRLAADAGGAQVIGFSVEGPDRSFVEMRICSDATCSKMTSASIPNANLMDVAIGTDGIPVVLYELTSVEPGRTTLLRCADSACSAFGVQADIGPGEDAAIAFGPDGNPVIAHMEPRQGRIGIVACSDPGCLGQVATTLTDGVVSEGSPETLVAIAVPSDGLPVILYDGEHPQTFEHGLQIIKCGDPECADAEAITVSRASVEEFAEEAASLAIGSNGLPLISYTADLFISVCADPGCLDGTIHRFLGTTALAVHVAVGPLGVPQVAYLNGGDLSLLTCADAACSQGTLTEPAEPLPPLEPLVSGTWSETPAAVAGFAPEANIEAIHGTSLGLIAFGYEGECLAEEFPFTCASNGYFSADGVSWRGFDAPPGAFGNIVETSSGLAVLAVADAADAAGGETIRTYSVWSSQDGESWTQVTVVGTRTGQFENRQGIDANELEQGHGELVIRGFEHGVGWAYWTSVDGAEWTRIPIDHASPDPGIPDSGWYAEELIVLPSGYLLLGNIEQCCDPYISTAAAWASDDLVTWEYLEDPERTRPYPFYTSSTTWSGGIFSAGLDCDEEGFCPDEEAVWVSQDGLGWTKATRDQAVFANVSLWEIEFGPGGPGLIGIGRHTDERTLGPVGVWTSADGLTWELIDSTEMVDLYVSAWIGGRFVAIGQSTGDPGLTSWIWTPGG
jgi:hypothetical protein